MRTGGQWPRARYEGRGLRDRITQTPTLFRIIIYLQVIQNGGRITVTTLIRKQDGRQDEASVEETERFLSVNNAQEDNKVEE